MSSTVTAIHQSATHIQTELNNISGRMNHHIDPHLDIWGWEIPVYLYLGGITAGILCLSAFWILLNKKENVGQQSTQPLSFLSSVPTGLLKALVWSPILLSLGMLTLFLDLEHPQYFWRFYTAFKPLSPMSWGAWILLVIYPINILLIMITLPNSYPKVAQLLSKKLGRFAKIYSLTRLWAIKHLVLICKISILIGASLGIYTGVLLESVVARPFWNSSILGPLFLISGLSTGAALSIILNSEGENNCHRLKQIDFYLILAELSLIGLFILSLLTGGKIKQDSLEVILGGPLTPLFWAGVVFTGLFLPVVLHLIEEYKNRNGAIEGFIPWLPAALVLLGGLFLRMVMVTGGQLSGYPF